MTTSTNFEILPPARLDPLRLAAAAYLARFKGRTRVHTESDLRCYFCWCAEHAVDPLAAARPHIELYVRWMQEHRRLAPSTVSRRLTVVVGFYRTCVIAFLTIHRPTTCADPPSHRNRPPWA